jgi:ABC-type lipoprotein release transport system permease subunit
LQGHLFGVSPTDPLTLGSVAILLCVIAIASTLGPAIRAAKLDPVEVLKAE